ncbi:hypothetical protein F4677DRAFT_84729 [Hypoxylon crocopeplum]|nr:hypothetical protein F4677DRAFT_84729 [Hypoxylon crocopeplum]
MVNGLERLERFFNGSRKRDRDRGARLRDLSIASSPPNPEDGLSFPSPSFMHPTSKHMRPREEAVAWARMVKERSQSLPDPHNKMRRRSSIGSISTVTNHRHHPSDPIRRLLISTNSAEDPAHLQKLSRFRFPEDSLFKNASTEASHNDLEKESTYEHTLQERRAENILDWCPQRISSLFNSLDLETSIDDRLAKSTDDVAVTLVPKPSPTLSAPPSPRTKVTSIVIPPRQSSRKSNERTIPDLTIPVRRLSPSPFQRPHPDSPPASDGEDEYPGVSFKQPTSVKGLASPIEFTPRQSTGYFPRDDTDVIVRRQSVRESWGTRLEDPVIVCTALDESPCTPQTRPVRKSASEASLSTITRYSTIYNDLREPALDDFYALDDEDVAEPIPTTPELEADVPPTPPPKDSPKTPMGRSRSTRHGPIAPTAAINFASGELTPPRTPTHSQFLTLTYSPTIASGVLGATWAASIASTYNFDLVYVISLWPKGQGNNSDPSRLTPQHLQRQAQNVGHIASQYSPVAHSKSKMSGRLLAAYGLNEFGSPFRIHAQFHTTMLGFKGWNEYRDELASAGMISRGWTCSFYSDHMPTVRNGVGKEGPAQDAILNRGIVFAAYTRKTTTSKIPVRSSPKQTAILGKLYRDAQTLVDTLIHGV